MSQIQPIDSNSSLLQQAHQLQATRNNTPPPRTQKPEEVNEANDSAAEDAAEQAATPAKNKLNVKGLSQTFDSFA